MNNLEKFSSHNKNEKKKESIDEKIGKIEAEAALEKTKSRVEILERHRILFVSCIESGNYEDLVYSNDDIPKEVREKVKNGVGMDDVEWFLKGLGWEGYNDRKRLSIFNALENGEYPSKEDISGIIIGGSPYMVGSDNYPWMKKLENYIRMAVKEKIPLLGVCFGHQMIAKALGGEITRTEKREFGTVQVDLTKEGIEDDLFRGLPIKDFNVQMSHSEVVFKLNEEVMTSLAFNSHNLNQSIAVGDNVRGIQFHPEIPKEVLEAIAYLRKDKIIQEGLNIQDIINNLKDTTESQKVLRNFDTYFVSKYHWNKK